MPSPHANVYPDALVLTGVLTKLFKGTGRQPSGVVILSREEFRGSTFPVEVVTCRLPDGRSVRMFCKYEGERSHEGHGHRGGVAYEADVYATVLASSAGSAPTFFGRHRDRQSGDTWLFIEKLDGASIANTHRPASLVALREAAGWIGRFHADFEARATSFSNIKRYDASYYRGFVDRVIEFSKGRRRRYPWLRSVCSRADEIISQLVSVQPTIIHGEFYPGNVIYDNGRICPVDWESTAVAPGELDLASLTEGWSPPLVQECEREYTAARWRGGTPQEFERTLAAARLCWAFRWLGDSRERFHNHRRSEARLARMLEEARRWPLIS
jgi:aminoglycoside phosphotransferase (APT) family kinase protein